MWDSSAIQCWEINSLSRISSARPKIADYPFTTLVPNLGVVNREGHRPFVVADIPGLIEGASKGAGLGLAFLRHVERTRLLIHLLDISEGPSRDAVKDFRTLSDELKAYDPLLQKKTQLVALNKIDLPSVRARAGEIGSQFEEMGYSLYLISGQTGEGTEKLMEVVFRIFESVSDKDHEQQGYS